MDRLFVRNLRLRCIVGVNPEERVKRQEVILSLTLSADLSAVRQSDDLADSVDYKAVTKKVIALVEDSRFYTVEALADRVADLCLENPLVQEAEVILEKPGALRFSESVGVVVTKGRGDVASGNIRR